MKRAKLITLCISSAAAMVALALPVPTASGNTAAPHPTGAATASSATGTSGPPRDDSLCSSSSSLCTDSYDNPSNG